MCVISIYPYSVPRANGPTSAAHSVHGGIDATEQQKKRHSCSVVTQMHWVLTGCLDQWLLRALIGLIESYTESPWPCPLKMRKV